MDPRVEYFNSLSPRERRIAIAEDILQQLEKQKFVDMRGDYISVSPRKDMELLRETLATKTLDDFQNTCYVCAKGAIVLSAMNLFDGAVKCGIYQSWSRVPEGLEDTFTQNMWGAIERVYELWLYGTVSDEVESYWESLSDRARMKAIFKNIIRNNGDFDPTDIPVAVSKDA